MGQGKQRLQSLAPCALAVRFSSVLPLSGQALVFKVHAGQACRVAQASRVPGAGSHVGSRRPFCSQASRKISFALLLQANLDIDT